MKNYSRQYLLYFSYNTRDENYLMKFSLRQKTWHNLSNNYTTMEIWLLYKSTWILKLVRMVIGVYTQCESMWIIQELLKVRDI